MSELIIKDWQNGIADSRVEGFADMRNVDIYSEPGFLKAGFVATKKSETTVVDFIKWFSVKNGAATNIYAFGDTNTLYTASGSASTWSVVSGNTTTSGSGNGMIVWKGYVITARNTAIDIYNIGTPGWTNGWAGLTLTSDAYHPMIIGQDDIVYIGNERYVASIQENAGQTFDPTNAATYTATAQALDLPSSYRVRCLEELGQYLMIGTWQGSNIYDKKVADIFPWDRTSSSFDIPIRLKENSILQMINADNTLYIVAGINHNIYTSNGTTASLFRKIPKTVWDQDGGYFTETMPQAIAQHRDRILTGTSVGTGGGVSPMGIFSVTKDGRLLFESQASTGSTNTVSIGAILAAGADNYLVSWKNTTGSAYGIDLIGANGKMTTSSSYARSQLYAVGSKKKPATFSSLEIQLGDVLASNQSVVVGYRTDTSSSFTTLATFSYATYGAAMSFDGDIGLIDIENIQIEVQVITGSGSDTSPKVHYVRLYNND